jgi:hypothetical protein
MDGRVGFRGGLTHAFQEQQQLASRFVGDFLDVDGLGSRVHSHCSHGGGGGGGGGVVGERKRKRERERGGKRGEAPRLQGSKAPRQKSRGSVPHRPACAMLVSWWDSSCGGPWK